MAEDKEKKIRAITRIYYSNPKIQEAIYNFCKERETIPQYFEGFGKRPDILQYPADIMGLVNKGATSFHCSEEVWENPLEINSEMDAEELAEKRKSWDLILDIDSPYLDYSKIAAKLIIEVLEKHRIKNYKIKFSGSKGFHIIVPSMAFPKTFDGVKTSKMFPEWPRAISEYLMLEIKPKYNEIISKSNINFKALQERTNLSKEDITESICPNCGKPSNKGNVMHYKCNRCKTEVVRKNHKISSRQLKCIDEICPGFLEIVKKESYFYCEHCKTSSFDKKQKSDKKVIYSQEEKFSRSSSFSDRFKEEISGESLGSLDLVLVASRHLFRAPYSLHEKTALASIVLDKNQLDAFIPKDANPFNVNPERFYPHADSGEAAHLLAAALAWKKIQTQKEETEIKKKYGKFEKINLSENEISEDLFPNPIKKLLKGLKDGRKRGLFILLTFLKSLNFSPDFINIKIREWNKKNKPALKEGYIKSQITWHLKQKRQILPPNYENKNFYKDLKLLDNGAMPNAKNPIVEVLRKVRKEKEYQS